MPNHVTNIIELECSRERSKEIMEFLRADGQDYGSVDFNKLIPMPESLNITSGSETDRGIEIYLTAVNPNTKDFGLEKMSPIEFDLLEIMLNCEKMFGKYNSNFRDLLSDGEEHEASECEARLNEAGISKSTAKKAKRILGVVSTKPHYSWYWRLPENED